jgi:hypothetical protein
MAAHIGKVDISGGRGATTVLGWRFLKNWEKES